MKVGLALAGGGVKGSYQIGAYYAFKKCHIQFNGIVGTSIGAANGAALASGKYKELLKMWKSIDPGALLEIEPSLLNSYKNNDDKIKQIVSSLKISSSAIKKHGFPSKNIKELMTNIIDVKNLKRNNIDYGLATFNFSKKEPVYIYKEDIPTADFINYVMASCSLPIFKLDKVIDNNLYIDGGFYDNCPTNMLLEKNYDLVYEVKINGIGLSRKPIKSNAKIITIAPSRDNGSIMEMNHDKIVDNIYMGYYDTLKVLNKYWGYKYIFNKTYFLNYDKAIKNVDKFTLHRIYNFFDVNSSKEAIIKSLEYIMEKEKYDYNEIYNIKRVIKNIKYDQNFVYEFIKGLSI
jgi:NTE family protein